MTLRTPAFNDAKTYGFEYLRHLAETLLNSEGVANYATDFLVTNAATGLRVDVAAGAAWVKGDSGTPGLGISQGLYSVVNDGAISNAVTLPAAHASNPRLDQIVLKVTDSVDLGTAGDVGTIESVTGTPTSGATLENRNGAAALPNDCLRLADVLVPAAATNLVAANVRDRRISASGQASRYIATAETQSGASYANLATPDLIDMYVPANAFVQLEYQALGKIATAAGQFAPHIIDYSSVSPVVTQLKSLIANGAPAVAEGGSSSAFYAPLYTTSNSNPLNSGTSGSSDTTEVATGLLAGAASGPTAGAPISIYGLPAGLYGFGMRFKNASGTWTVKERRLAVRVFGNGRSS